MLPSSTISAVAGTCSVLPSAVDDLGAAAAQQAGELVFGQAVGHRRDRAQDGGRVGAQRHRHRVGLAGMGDAVLAEVLRAAAVRQPAHDDLVAREHLLAVDAQVLARLVRAARDDQPPGDERRHVARPAVLHRQARQVHVRAFPHHVLAGGRARHLGRHVPQRLEQAAQAQHVLEALGCLGLLEIGQQFAEGPQLAHVGHAHGARHAGRGAKQVAQHRHAVAGGLLEQQGRAARAQGPVAQARSSPEPVTPARTPAAARPLLPVGP